MTEIIHSHIIGVTFAVTFLLFCFFRDFTECLSNLLIGKWCIVTIIVINKSFQQICMVFFFWGGHARSFRCHGKSVQNVPTTFE